MAPGELKRLQSWVDEIFNEATPGCNFDRQRALCNFIAHISFGNHKAVVKDIELLGSYLYCLYLAESASRSGADNQSAETRLETLVRDATLARSLKFGANAGINDIFIGYLDKERLGRNSAEIVRFLLGYNPDAGSRAAASIKMAHYFFCQTNGFGGDHPVSYRAFQESWQKSKDVCHFQYVNYYHFKSWLDVRPTEEGFAEKIDSLLADMPALKRYFQQSRYVFEQLMERLDRRATLEMRFPALPHSFKATETKDAAIPIRDMKIMARYASTFSAGF